MYFFNEHPCQAEARNAARHALTLILLYEHILRMTNEAEKLPAALPQLKCLQENGPIITEKRSSSMPYPTRGQRKHIYRDGILREVPTRIHAIFLNAWQFRSNSTKVVTLLKIPTG